jgi:hypothetical protein
LPAKIPEKGILMIAYVGLKKKIINNKMPKTAGNAMFRIKRDIIAIATCGI